MIQTHTGVLISTIANRQPDTTSDLTQSLGQNDLVETKPPSGPSQSVAKVPIVDTNPSNQPATLHFLEEQPKQPPTNVPKKQDLNASVPEWLPVKSGLPNQHEGYPHDYSFQQELMETQDRQNIALQQLVQQQQQSVMALTLP